MATTRSHKRKHPWALPANVQAAILVVLASAALIVLIGVPILSHAHS